MTNIIDFIFDLFRGEEINPDIWTVFLGALLLFVVIGIIFFVFRAKIDLAWFQFLLIGLIGAIFLTADLSDFELLQGAYTASDLLRGYLLWTRIVLWAGVICVVLAALVNFLVYRTLKQRGDFRKKHIALAVVSASLALVLAVGANWGALSAIRDIREDIAAIENDNLLVADYYLHLTWENYYRTASLRDMGEYRPLYVVRRDNIGRVYFPRPFSPTALKAMVTDEIYQIPGRSPSFRLFQIYYTPQTQIVVDVRPVRDAS